MGTRLRVGEHLPLAVLVGAAMAVGACGGKSVPPETAAQLITETAVRTWVDRIAADSMRGRDTPSPELDQLATVLAGEFERLGFEPMDDSGFVRRYAILRRRLIPERSALRLDLPGAPPVVISFGDEVAFAQGSVPDAPLVGNLVVLGGPIDPSAIAADSVRGRVVAWLADLTGPAAATVDAIAATLVAAGPAVVVMIPNDPSFLAGAASMQAVERVAPEGASGLTFTALAASESALARAVPALGWVFEEARRAKTMVLRSTGYRATIEMADTVVGRTSAPNVVARRRGSDPALSAEYVVLSAHMDHLGIAPSASGDSIYNGADDNGSGTAGLIALAAALGTPGLELRRSIVLVLVSGEEKGLWGSAQFVSHSPIPIASMVADINLDMIGRNWRDTVGVIGREHSDLGDLLDQVAARHPELEVTPVGDRWPDEHRFFRSDHYNFARAGVPILFLSSGYSPDYHAVTDEAATIDAEKEARLVRLVFHFSVELANRTDRPRWNPDSYREITGEAPQ